jgi:hypothetical protein
VLFEPDLDPLDDGLPLALFDEEVDRDVPPVLAAPVLRDEVEADFVPPRDEADVFELLLLLELPPLLPDELFDADGFDVPLLFEEVLLVPEEDLPREDAVDLLALDFDEPPEVPLFDGFDDDDFAEVLLLDVPLLPAELLLDDFLPDEDELFPDDDVLLVFLDELLRDELLPPPRPVDVVVEPTLGETMSTAVDAAPTTAPVAAPPRRSVATSATFSTIALTAEPVLEPLDFFEELEAERF